MRSPTSPCTGTGFCGIDIGKAEMYATIRVPSDKDPARRMSETRSFATTKRGVLALAGWLRSWQVPAVVMEATSTYWMGPFFRLEFEGFECVLADASALATYVHRVLTRGGDAPALDLLGAGRVAGGEMAELVRARRLSDEERRRLLQIVRRGKHGSVRVRRAMIIMASASGTVVPAIARLVAAGEDTVRDVIHAFNEKGLAALDPRWAGGRPRLISDEDIEVIVAAARTRPEKLGQPFTRWSLRKLAGY